jgi:hypothetical protein
MTTNPDVSSANCEQTGATSMNPSFHIDFSQHEERIRRAEQRYALMTATKTEEPMQPQPQPRRRLSSLLRRIAGTAAAA